MWLLLIFAELTVLLLSGKEPYFYHPFTQDKVLLFFSGDDKNRDVSRLC